MKNIIIFKNNLWKGLCKSDSTKYKPNKGIVFIFGFSIFDQIFSTQIYLPTNSFCTFLFCWLGVLQIVAHFTASWCMPSVVMNSFFEELASTYQDVLFLTVDVDDVKVFHFFYEKRPSLGFKLCDEVKKLWVHSKSTQMI